MELSSSETPDFQSLRTSRRSFRVPWVCVGYSALRSLALGVIPRVGYFRLPAAWLGASDSRLSRGKAPCLSEGFLQSEGESLLLNPFPQTLKTPRTLKNPRKPTTGARTPKSVQCFEPCCPSASRSPGPAIPGFVAKLVPVPRILGCLERLGCIGL